MSNQDKIGPRTEIKSDPIEDLASRKDRVMADIQFLRNHPPRERQLSYRIAKQRVISAFEDELKLFGIRHPEGGLEERFFIGVGVPPHPMRIVTGNVLKIENCSQSYTGNPKEVQDFEKFLNVVESVFNRDIRTQNLQENLQRLRVNKWMVSREKRDFTKLAKIFMESNKLYYPIQVGGEKYFQETQVSIFHGRSRELDLTPRRDEHGILYLSRGAKGIPEGPIYMQISPDYPLGVRIRHLLDENRMPTIQRTSSILRQHGIACERPVEVKKVEKLRIDNNATQESISIEDFKRDIIRQISSTHDEDSRFSFVSNEIVKLVRNRSGMLADFINRVKTYLDSSTFITEIRDSPVPYRMADIRLVIDPKIGTDEQRTIMFASLFSWTNDYEKKKGNSKILPFVTEKKEDRIRYLNEYLPEATGELIAETHNLGIWHDRITPSNLFAVKAYADLGSFKGKGIDTNVLTRGRVKEEITRGLHSVSYYLGYTPVGADFTEVVSAEQKALFKTNDFQDKLARAHESFLIGYIASRQHAIYNKSSQERVKFYKELFDEPPNPYYRNDDDIIGDNYKKNIDWTKIEQEVEKRCLP